MAFWFVPESAGQATAWQQPRGEESMENRSSAPVMSLGDWIITFIVLIFRWSISSCCSSGVLEQHQSNK
jgi:hypothetical protein